MRQRFVNLLGVNASIAWILLNKLFSIFKVPLTVYFILRYLTPQEQGIWYTFISLGALSMLAELGFTGIISQYISHEFAHLKEQNGILVGDEAKIDRTIGLIRFSIKLYMLIIPLAIIMLCGVGFFYFGRRFDAVFSAWTMFSVVGGLTLLSSLLQAVYQGLDKVKESQQNLLIGTISMTLCLLFFLFLGAGIWSLVLGNLVGLAAMLALLYRKAPQFWKQVITANASRKHSWLREIAPLQIKYTLTFVSGFFIFYLFVPAIYKYENPILAGQFGITLAVVSSITGFAFAWVASNIPQFNIMVARQQRLDLIAAFKGSFIRSLVIFCALSIAVFVCFWLLERYSIYQNRLLNLTDTFLLMIAQVPMVIVGGLSIYLRAHKEEPYYGVSIVTAVCAIISVFVILPRYGFPAFLVSLIIANFLIMLPLGIYVFHKCVTDTFPRKYYLRDLAADSPFTGITNR